MQIFGRKYLVREIDTLPLKSNRCSAIITIAGADKRKTYLHLNAFSNFVFNSHAGAKGKRKKIKKEDKEEGRIANTEKPLQKGQMQRS